MPTEMPAKTWQAVADRHFGFLRTEFQYAITGSSEERMWSARIVYQNRTNAVEVLYSGEFERVEVQLVRLVDGERPPYPTFISQQPVLHHFLLDSLVELRAPELLATIKPHFSLDPDEVDLQLSLWANALRNYGADVLRGDFSVFKVLESELREFVRLHPEQVTAWFPHTAKGPDEREVARIQSYAPTIPLAVREYARPASPLVGRLRHLLSRIAGRH